VSAHERFFPSQVIFGFNSANIIRNFTILDAFCSLFDGTCGYVLMNKGFSTFMAKISKKAESWAILKPALTVV